MKQLQLTKPRLLIVTGIPASGKTSFAEHFASTFRAPFFEPSRILDLNESADSEMVLDNLLEQFLRTGKTILYETIGGTKQERLDISKYARAHGYEPLVIWVQTDPAAAKARALKRKKNARTYSDEEFVSLLHRFTSPRSGEDHVVISGMHTHASQAKAVLRRLTESGGRGAGQVNTPDARSKTRSAPRLVQ
jgi:predicted kinase